MEENINGLKEYLKGEKGFQPIYFIRPTTDYIDIKCARCGNDCLVEFLGTKENGVFNELRFICETCEEDSTHKCEKLIDASKED